MSKGDLMKLVLSKEELNYCDSAIPQSLWNTCDTSLHVYDCKNNKLVNLAERLVTSGKLQEILDEKEHTEYLFKHIKRKFELQDKSDDELFMLAHQK